MWNDNLKNGRKYFQIIYLLGIYYSEFLWLNIKKTTQFKKKKKQDQRTWIDISPKKDTQMANKHVKRCSSLIIKEMQIRAIGRYFFMPTIL